MAKIPLNVIDEEAIDRLCARYPFDELARAKTDVSFAYGLLHIWKVRPETIIFEFDRDSLKPIDAGAQKLLQTIQPYGDYLRDFAEAMRILRQIAPQVLFKPVRALRGKAA